MTALLSLVCLLPGFEKELRLLPLLLRPGHVCIDVGASLGIYSIPMAMLVGASGAVVAFEPRIQAASRLRRLGQVLRLSALQVQSTALSRVPGRSPLVVPGRRRAVPGRSYLAGNSVCSALDDGLRPVGSLDVTVGGVRRRAVRSVWGRGRRAGCRCRCAPGTWSPGRAP